MQPIRSALSLVSGTLRAAGSAALAHLATVYLVHHSARQAAELRRLMAAQEQSVPPRRNGVEICALHIQHPPTEIH